MLAGNPLRAQQPLPEEQEYLETTGKVVDENENRLTGVTVMIVNTTDSTTETFTLAKNGNIRKRLEYNKEYVFIFHKLGYIKKKFVINTVMRKKVESSYAFTYEVTLYDHITPDMGGELIDKPVGKVFYSQVENKFDFDKAYQKKMKEDLKKIPDATKNQLAKSIEEQLKEEKKDLDSPQTTPNKDAPNPNNMAYNMLIAQAENDLADSKFASAREKYIKAQALKPGDKFVLDKLAAVDRILEEQKQKDINDRYDAAIKRGDNAFDQLLYDLAKKEYAIADQIKPGENYAKNKIKIIDSIIAVVNAEMEKNNKYASAVDRGDKAFIIKKYLEAKAAYDEALKIKPEEKYPAVQIAQINEILDKERFQNQVSVLYNEAIRTAEKEYDQENYSEAIANYKKASVLIPTKLYPKQKIDEIEKLQRDLENITNVDKIYNKVIAENFISKSEIITSPNEKVFHVDQQKKAVEQNKVKVANMNAKYETLNPLTSLLDVVDDHQKRGKTK